jgi:hypothetical protein
MAKNKTLVVPQAQQVLDQLKYEVASEMGITLEAYNGNKTAREMGTIGGQMTRRLVQIAEQTLHNGRR